MLEWISGLVVCTIDSLASRQPTQRGRPSRSSDGSEDPGLLELLPSFEKLTVGVPRLTSRATACVLALASTRQKNTAPASRYARPRNAALPSRRSLLSCGHFFFFIGPEKIQKRAVFRTLFRIATRRNSSFRRKTAHFRCAFHE
jgi:hypothetical protein